MDDIQLITGANGLLGSNLARTLSQQGKRVRILVRQGSHIDHLADLPQLEKVVGDITQPDSLAYAMQGVATVYHCAAQVSISRQLTPRVWQTNVEGTENVLQAFQKSNARRLVHCSSVDALGLPTDSTPSTEDTPWNWDRLGVETAYARCKYVAQQRVLQAARRGVEAVIVCPTYMFGPYDSHPSSGQMILSIQQHRLLPRVSGGNNFIDVQDVVDGMIAAAEMGKPGQVYILGHANLTYDQVFQMIASALGKHVTSLPIPPALLDCAGYLGEGIGDLLGKEVPINTAVTRLSRFYHYYDSTKAQRELGLPQRPIEEAISQAINWFRLRGMLPAN